MILDVTCTDSGILAISKVIKNFFYWLQIIGPILAMISLAILIAKSVTTNDNNNIKKYQKNMINSLIAMAMLFFLPYLMDLTMQLIGNNSSFTTCWNSIDNVKLNFGSNYIKTEKEEKSQKEKPTKAYADSKDYHGKVTTSNLDLSCTSKTVKSQFSCDTLKIVEKHLYDFDATTFTNVINSYGGFENYAKSVGGIFGEYYGKQMPNVTESDFQRAAEYVLGWMYMYGWDYMNTQGNHYKWGTGSKYSKDAFYVNGGWRREYSGKFDDLIAGKNGLDMLSSECGDLEIFVYWKMGISRKRSISNPTSLRNLKVGDALFFYDISGGKKTWRHTVLVGEVYNDRIVCYDAGSRYTRSRNYKYTVEIPNENSAFAELAALKKHYAYDGWIAKRYYNFKSGS